MTVMAERTSSQLGVQGGRSSRFEVSSNVA
jgi:hypothetical protein